MNITDGMDAARFASANPYEEETSDRPDPASPQAAYEQMAQQPPLPPGPSDGDHLRNHSEKGEKA